MSKRSAPTEADEAKRGPTNAQIVLRNGLPERVPLQPRALDVIDTTLQDAGWPLDLVGVVRGFSRREASIPSPAVPERPTQFNLMMDGDVVLHLVPRPAIPERKIEATVAVLIEHKHEQLLAFEANRLSFPGNNPQRILLYSAKTDRDTGIDLFDVSFSFDPYGIGWEDLRNGTKGHLLARPIYSMAIDAALRAATLPALRGDPEECLVRSSSGAVDRCVWLTHLNTRRIHFYEGKPTQPRTLTGGFFPANVRPPSEIETWRDAENELVTNRDKSLDAEAWLCFDLGPHAEGPDYATLVLCGKRYYSNAISHKLFHARRNELLACLRQAAKYPYEFRGLTVNGFVRLD
jgi:hypothetical protein